MIINMVYVDEDGLQTLEHGHIYDVPDKWGRLMVKDGASAEYLEISK